LDEEIRQGLNEMSPEMRSRMERIVKQREQGKGGHGHG